MFFGLHVHIPSPKTLMDQPPSISPLHRSPPQPSSSAPPPPPSPFAPLPSPHPSPPPSPPPHHHPRIRRPHPNHLFESTSLLIQEHVVETLLDFVISIAITTSVLHMRFQITRPIRDVDRQF